MILSVVAPPCPENNFNGKIVNMRVSEMGKYAKATCHQRFTDVAWINGTNNDCEWKKYGYPLSLERTLLDLKRDLQDGYNLDNDTTDRLCLRYYVGEDGKQKPKYITSNDHPIDEAILTRDYTLMVMMKKRRNGEGC